MSEVKEKMDSTTSNRLDELLAYVHHVGQINQKPIFRIEEYKQLTIWEHELKGKIGIQHNIIDNDGISVWLRIERLKRFAPPSIPEHIQDWIAVENDPESKPQIKDKIIKTLTEQEANKLVAEGVVIECDVTDPLKEEMSGTKLKDVIFRLENNQQIKTDIDSYLNEQWFPWSEEEKPRRVTIKIYDSLFSLQQTIEAQGDEQPIELIWGIGISRWLCEGHKINHPLLEKPIEIEVDRKDGTILIHPRNNEPTIAVGAYFALKNPGVDALLRFGKKHFSEMSDNIEFSPYIHESFEPILRQASTHLSESGTYWPDINHDKENREPNKISDSLELTDSWVLFARPRSATGFIQDIERFQKELEESKSTDTDIPNPTKKLVTELSDKKPIQTGGGFLSDSGSSSSSSGASQAKKQKTELFFPKAFNDSQVQIIDRLEENDGVVVQGPPGTGKTHTIANIICHYLATGRSVLVTSKGESALSVLQDQIPDELRALTISLLANERQGMKQLEAAVELLAGLVSQTSLGKLNQEAESNALRVKQLKREINEIDEKIKDWGLKQLNPVGQKLTGEKNEITAMELARLVIDDSGAHEWFTDELGSSDRFSPKFTDSDIAIIRAARRKVGKDICYVGKSIPQLQDLPDSANIAAIHDDLSASAKIAMESKSGHIPPLAVSVEKSVDRAKQLIKPLRELGNLLDIFQENSWLQQLFYSWIEGASTSNDENTLFNELLIYLDELIERRQIFVKTLVEIPDPYHCFEGTQAALSNLANNKRAFGIFSFGSKEAKTIIERAKVEGETPKDAETWQLVLDYVTYQDDIRKFIIKWNHAGQELDLPEFVYQYGSLYKDIQAVQKTISNAKHLAGEWHSISHEIGELFPHGIDLSKIIVSKLEIDKAIKAIEFNTSRISLGAQRIKLQDLMEKLKKSDGDIANSISDFVNTAIGNPEYSSDKIIQHWQELGSELNRINELIVHLNDIERIAESISESGAPIWGSKLKSEPLLEEDDALTPADWYETWRWNQRKQYLHEIDGREHHKKLSQKRARLDNDLKRTFSKLVRIKTNIGLHMSMTERVQGALMRFVSSVAKIGKGTGKRAPRHRRDAYRAMQDCYSGVPCWIMPTWRVSESLPSDFGSFDLVIIDEASQSDITALPAILRAKKLLIVGDDKQVSPTAAFLAEEKILQLKHNFLREQPFAELLLPGISVYDLANAVFPGQRIMLTEHFRCVEPIIRFSMQFYNEPLIPLRIPKSSEKLTPPLVDVYVKGGQRDDRSKINEVEAEGIISEIKAVVANPKYKGRSIGVISLIGAQQAKYIQDQLLIELGEDIFQEYKIACGDAATFQGKERDIVFLSMVVGSRQGAVMSKRDAEQRMNVALSRARDRMYLYRSIQESDLSNESDLRLKILRHFSSPMPQLKQVDNPIDLCDSDFERDVYKRLTAKGYNVVPQVKVGAFSIDLVVEGENDQRLAIELDGDKYHPPEQWMNDWKRQRTMERVGWQFWRCWGSSYTIDPEGCIDDLINVLNNMQIVPCEISSGANIYTEQRIYEKQLEIENDDLDFELVPN
ncbi:putative DNA helicase [Desulfamplus magnetovallimortis]|uniref:Putative DNA helicase n=1 Tax=Desulfamplus magnetovallimortis TaxID=1246637 RepID=A0A1W1HI04_9BACT|nr:AAA domain-containing protein [Desulfamplus magnetovallimortis]SLM32104.1 putative DNA helicase [Desulfamplus magnetovallimortis]